MAGKRSRNRIFYILLIIAFVFVLRPQTAQAAQEQFVLSLDSQELQVGVGANMVVSLINANNAQVKEIKGLENFDVLSTSQSSMTQIINNVTSVQNDTTYVIMPKAAGTFTLQATVEYNGSTYQTNEVQVKVTEVQDQTNATNGEASDIFLKTDVSDKDIYFGQKLALSYELYTRYNLENYGFLDNVNIDGFVANEVSQDKLGSNYVTINNNKYLRYDIKEMYLAPVKTGTYTIPAFNFQANASTGGFFGSSQPFYLKTDAQEITVKPLPQEGQPADFSGIVGKLNIDAAYDKQTTDYSGSVTLNVTASGNCNLDGLNKIIKDSLPGFSVYETEKSSEEDIQDEKYFAKKQFNIILVPENTGDIKIDPIKISFFNPETGSYEYAKIPGTTITVTGEIPQVNTQQSQSSSLQTVEISQVSYGSTPDTGVLTLRISKTVLYTCLAAAAAVIILAVVILLYLKKRKKQDKTLTAYYKQLQKTNDLNEIYNYFNNIVKYRFNINLKANSREVIINRLNENGEMEQGLTGPILEIMDLMERMASDIGVAGLKNKIKDIYKKI